MLNNPTISRASMLGVHRGYGCWHMHHLSAWILSDWIRSATCYSKKDQANQWSWNLLIVEPVQPSNLSHFQWLVNLNHFVGYLLQQFLFMLIPSTMQLHINIWTHNHHQLTLCLQAQCFAASAQQENTWQDQVLPTSPSHTHSQLLKERSVENPTPTYPPTHPLPLPHSHPPIWAISFSLC